MDASENLTALLQKIGIEDEGIDLFIFVVQPLIAEFIEQLLLNTFNDEDVMAIEKAAASEEVTEAQMPDLYSKLYFEKTGKSIEDESIAVIKDMITTMQENIEILVKLATQVNTKDISDEKKEELIESYARNLINRQAYKIKLLNNKDE